MGIHGAPTTFLPGNDTTLTPLERRRDFSLRPDASARFNDVRSSQATTSFPYQRQQSWLAGKTQILQAGGYGRHQAGSYRWSTFTDSGVRRHAT